MFSAVITKRGFNRKMKSLIYLTFLKFGYLMNYPTLSALQTTDNVNFISDIFNVYKPTSIILIHSTDKWNWSQMKLIFNIQLLLSRKKIVTLTLSLEELASFKNNSLRNIKNDTKTMSVFFLTTEKALKEMKVVPMRYLSKFINILLFTNKTEPLLQFCMNPTGNEFFFRNDISFIVKCYKDSVIQKWRPLKSKQMSVFEWATWVPKRGLVLKEENLEYKDFYQLDGQVLIATSVKEQEKLMQFTDNILLALKLAANFTIIKIEAQESYGSWDKKSQSWTGATGLVANGKVDIAASLFLMTSNRIDSIDYSVPIKDLEMCLYIRDPSNKVSLSWTIYLKPFTTGSWTAIVLFFKLSHLLLTFIKTKREKYFGNGRFVLENYLTICRCFFQQSLPEFPTASSLRIAYFTIFSFAFCIVSIYSGCFTSYSTVATKNVPFESVEDFLKDGSYQVAVIQNSENYDFFQDTTSFPWIEMSRLLINEDEMPSSLEDVVNMVCHEKVALWSDEMDFLLVENAECPLLKIRTGKFVPVGMIFRKDNPYTQIINYHISKLRESGLLSYLESKIEFDEYNSRSDSQHYYTYEIVNFWHISSLAVLITGGIILAVIILCFEKFYFGQYYKKIFGKIC